MAGLYTQPNTARTHRGRSVRCRAAGFTLVEILIVVVILGILAMIVVPQFSSARAARENTLRDDLRFLRTQIGVFAAQHRDLCPGYPGGDTTSSPTETDFVDQMTLHTSEACAAGATKDATYKYGPYLSKVPTNPLNGLTTMLIIDNGAAVPAADDSTGWIYKAETKEIYANLSGSDATGTPYAEY